MRIIKVPSLLPTIDNVILFSEDSKHDYIFNHQLSIVSDVDDPDDHINARLYDIFPDETLVSDRQCLLKTLGVRRGYV